jgi:hypothetical protein
MERRILDGKESVNFFTLVLNCTAKGRTEVYTLCVKISPSFLTLATVPFLTYNLKTVNVSISFIISFTDSNSYVYAVYWTSTIFLI